MPRRSRPSRRRVTSYDVARLAGVSQSAVSRCFAPGASVSAEGRARVEAAARALGYAPNAIARSLITRRTDLVAVLVTQLTTANYPDILHHLGAALRTAGKQLLLATLDREDEAGAAVGRLLAYQPEGIVACASLGREVIERCAGSGLAVVMLNRFADGAPAAVVACDHRAGSRMLARAALAAGYRRVVYIAGPADAPVSAGRLRGFGEAMAEAGLGFEAVLHADYAYEGGRRAVLAQVQRARPPELVACANDAMALGAMDALRFDLGLRVPDDVGVVGFDDLAESGRPAYALTTVRQPVRRMSRLAVELLLARIGEPAAPPERLLIEGTLVPRASARLGTGH